MIPGVATPARPRPGGAARDSVLESSLASAAGPPGGVSDLRGSSVTLTRIRTAIGALALSALPLLAPSTPLADARPDTLADSTWTVRWTLKNGLEVSARHIPDANAVAVIAAYRVGRDQDPPGQDGLAELLGEVLLTAQAGDVPERSRDEMAELRPRGWNLQVTQRFSLISELVPPARFPGLLRQMAARMRGVTVNDSVMTRSRRVVGRDLAERYLGSPELALIYQSRDLAAGLSDQDIIRRASGRTIQTVTAKEAGDRLSRLYVPANAALAIAGNLEGVDLPGLVASLFESIPAGTALREPARPPLKAASRTITRAGLDQPLGVATIIAPPLEDPLHPSFYLNSLFIGRFCETRWGQAPAPLPGRFRYAVFADPTVAQLFPPAAPDETDADQLGISIQDAVEALSVTIVDPVQFDDLRVNHAWIFGGPLTPPFRTRIRQHTGTLHTLASTLAVQALWGSREFWALYLQRFLDPKITGGERWADYYQDPAHVVRLLMTPAKR